MMLFRLYEFFKVACVQCRGIERGRCEAFIDRRIGGYNSGDDA